jgi:molybdopterin converting factor small subunit
MQVVVQFFSYFKDLTGCTQTTETVAEGQTVEDLLGLVFQKFPALAAMRQSMLIAVGLEYQKPSFVLRDGDEVSLFPPVQGG